MKKFIFSICLTTVILSFIALSQVSTNDNNPVLNFKKIDANNVSTTIRNDGSFDKNYMTGSGGFEWPQGSGKTAIYISGLWLSSKVNDSIRVSYSDYDSEFEPGYFDYATQTPMGKDDPLYRIYKVSPSFPNGNSDFDPWSAWPVNQGAPWVDVNNNGTYEPPADYPVMKGSQNLFCSFTDGYKDTSATTRNTPPMRAEVHLYAYAKENSGCVSNTVYYEWKIINKNISQWTDMSAAIWSDFDIGTSNNDKAGTDSTLNLVYGYNGINNDPVYGIAPPAVGYLIKEATGHSLNKSDFAVRWRCAFDCPTDSLQMYRVLHGLRINGSKWINPLTNKATMFPFSGDPVTSAGWIDSTQGERYILIGSIFGTVATLDTIDFKTVTFINKGADNLQSIVMIKNCVSDVISVKQLSTNIPLEFKLDQNYPNPFNPKTVISYKLAASSFISLKVYNSLGKEVAVLVNQQQNVGSYEIDFDASGLASGVYFYRIAVHSDKLESENFSDTNRMILLK
ncbi:MAG: T9SS type A sorting domain-containing protein [Ignavibacteria bacterium]